MEEYFCQKCGYVYKPSEGDCSNRIPPNISFADLLDSWTCPQCYSHKKVFRRCSRSGKIFGEIGRGDCEDQLGGFIPDKLKLAG